MCKYMCKAKVSREVAVMEVITAQLRVHTHARALMLQRPQKQQQLLQRKQKEDIRGEYLELRSRRLEKLPPPMAAARRCGRRKAVAWEEAKASFRENMLKLEAMERSTRETTPCSLIRSSETISTPGSTTRPNHLNSLRKVQAPVCLVPSLAELDEFFAAEERKQQQAFIDKFLVAMDSYVQLLSGQNDCSSQFWDDSQFASPPEEQLVDEVQVVEATPSVKQKTKRTKKFCEEEDILLVLAWL